MERIAKDTTETVKMVETAMAVLDLLRTAKEPLGVNTIAKQCDISPSTTHRILKTFEKTGWVYQLNDDARYIVGEKISFVTNKNNFYAALSDTAGLIMADCTAHHGMAMNLIVREGPDCVVIQQSLTKSIINYVPPKGSVLPYYACGGGKILLSELPENMLNRIFELRKMEALTPFTVLDIDTYRQMLDEVRQTGYAIDFQESSINGSCVAVPVRDDQGTIIASLSFSGLIGVSGPEKLVKYVPYLQEASAEITRALYQNG